jgi:hypothetical protein
MPYVKQNHRKKLDPVVQRVASELATASASLEKPQEIGQVYFAKFFEIVRVVRAMELGLEVAPSTSPSSRELTKAIFDVATEDGSFWAGDLNYVLTRIIQLVPRNLVERGKWNSEFRYWIYAVTAGALERTALAAGQIASEKERHHWVETVLVGVLLDIKDEYKRRVNAPYEQEQQALNGDCYDVRLSRQAS